MIPSAVKKFWSKVERRGPNECWPWKGKTVRGYGYWTGGRAHRTAWEEANRLNIPKGMHVLHSCDQPACCNPAHLTLGTHAQNMADKARKGRASLKAHHPWQKDHKIALAALSMMG